MSTPGGQKVWVENKGDAHPKSGDIYVLVNPGGAQIKHIGVFVGSEPKDQDSEYWTTADAGQGMGVAQKAVYSTKEGRGTGGEQAGRIYNKKDKTVTGMADKGEVLGWVDLDAALAWQAADDAAKAKAQADAAAKQAAKKKK